MAIIICSRYDPSKPVVIIVSAKSQRQKQQHNSPPLSLPYLPKHSLAIRTGSWHRSTPLTRPAHHPKWHCARSVAANARKQLSLNIIAAKSSAKTGIAIRGLVATTATIAGPTTDLPNAFGAVIAPTHSRDQRLLLAFSYLWVKGGWCCRSPESGFD